MLRALAGILALATLGSAASGCAARAPLKPPGEPPTPKTITRENPGGDAADPERAALERLDHAAWGVRRDRFGSLLVPLLSAPDWTRVKLWGYPTRAAYRFGDEHYGVVAIWYQLAEGKDDPESCLDRFLEAGRVAVDAYGVQATKMPRVRTVMRGSARPMVIQSIDASVESILSSGKYAGAVASYSTWPGRCLVQGFVVVATEHAELARRIRDRWVREGAPRLAWMPRVTEPPTTEAR